MTSQCICCNPTVPNNYKGEEASWVVVSSLQAMQMLSFSHQYHNCKREVYSCLHFQVPIKALLNPSLPEQTCTDSERYGKLQWVIQNSHNSIVTHSFVSCSSVITKLSSSAVHSRALGTIVYFVYIRTVLLTYKSLRCFHLQHLLPNFTRRQLEKSEEIYAV